MAAKEIADSRQHVVHLGRSDIKRQEDGSYLLPVTLDSNGQRTRALMCIDPDDAARLHAQLDRHLNQGLAMTEEARAAKNPNEYLVDGNIRFV